MADTDHAACRIGCASWSLPREMQDRFAGEGQHLHRYALRFAAAEINSSFHRPHSRGTYERWGTSVPPDFRFSVKLPRTITHERQLRDCGALLEAFLAQARGLGERLECLLVQLPPKLALDAAVAASFFGELRLQWPGCVAAEPRHASWFTPAVDAFLAERQIARVLADPVRHPGGERPGGWQPLVYLRLHGSPRTYYSSYSDALLRQLAARIELALAAGQRVWCIFDNTASGAATHNALTLQSLLQPAGLGAAEGAPASDEWR